MHTWEWENGDKTLVLHLRKGLKWSDGYPFTADNYAWWFENVLTNEEINPGRNKALGWSGYNVETIRKVDETHVQYVLPSRADGFLDQLATYRIGGFTLQNGRYIDVERDWGKRTVESRFLADVNRQSCRIFNTVLGPNYNYDHRNHFHLDIGRYKTCK